jgi:hypothetical protein
MHFWKWCAFTLLLLVVSISATLAADMELDKASSLPPEVPSALASLFTQPGAKVLTAEGKAWCELWVRKELPRAPQPASPKAKYGELHTGLLVALIRFPETANDYRGQQVKPGIYTLRYALVPQDGNHMGVSPILDFLMLTPIQEDTQSADATIAFKDLMVMSRHTTGTNHPAALLMSYPPESASPPALELDDREHWFYKTKVQLKPGGELKLGIVIFGKTEG